MCELSLKSSFYYPKLETVTAYHLHEILRLVAELWHGWSCSNKDMLGLILKFLDQ